MKAKILVYVLPTLILATIQFAEAQQRGKIPRIGVLIGGPAAARLYEVFRQGLVNSVTSKAKTSYWSFGMLQTYHRSETC